MSNKKEYSVISAVGKCAAHNSLITAGVAATVAGAVGFALAPPLVLENIIDNLVSGKSIAMPLALLYFAMLAVSCIFDALRECLITVFGQKITHTVRSDMCAKLSRLPAAYFDAGEPGAAVSRFVGDVDTLESLFSSGIIGMFADACKIVSILCVVFYKSRGLGLLLLAATPLLFAFTRFVQKNMLRAQTENRESIARLNSFVPETIRNIRTVHVLRREKYMQDKYSKMVEESYKAVEKVNFYDAVYSPVILIIGAFLVSVMMVLAATGGEMQSFFGMSVGTAVAVTAYVGKIFAPLESIGMEIQTVQSAAAGVRRIKEFMNEPERAETDKEITTQSLAASSAQAVSAENVFFSYDGVTPVLAGASFSADSGESVTLAGRTGAGKSTLLKLLLGLYSPCSGEVRVFGVNSDRIPDRCKRKLFGYVGQSFRPVPGSVADQISVFDSEISQADVERASKLAGVHEAISALEYGYMTPYSDSLFSRGQRQLLAIARAVAANPRILLLDEITANLDADTEENVLSALENASRERTVISVSHRLYEHRGGTVVNIDRQ